VCDFHVSGVVLGGGELGFFGGFSFVNRAFPESIPESSQA
jgi:hypothetical protein